ncbi:AMP-binding protein, partial [Pseudomonas gingeri]|nr:AMP-binding protein [Pseudomonas gingeri]
MPQVATDRAVAADRVDPSAVIPAQVRRQSLILQWNERLELVREPDTALIQQLFESQVLRDPSAPALGFMGQVLSYDQLNTRANRLAHHLRSLGVGPDTRVAVCLERSPQMLV